MSNARKNKGVAISLLKLLLGELETTEDLFSDSMSLEEHTFQIGRNAGKRMMLRLIRDLPLYSSQLDGVKIICKEFWHACFNKEANKLQTNYKDTFVIHSWYENSWLTHCPRLAEKPATTGMLRGLVQGALDGLGWPETKVNLEIKENPDKNQKSCVFRITTEQAGKNST